MPIEKVTCAYIKCALGEDGGRKERAMIKGGMYCCPKHGLYQRRLDKAKLDKQKGEGE